jgi:hypothetical protein
MAVRPPRPAATPWLSPYLTVKDSDAALDTKDLIRAAGLESGLVDNKACAIDAIWSGLRFVFRRKDRPSRSV